MEEYVRARPRVLNTGSVSRKYSSLSTSSTRTWLLSLLVLTTAPLPSASPAPLPSQLLFLSTTMHFPGSSE